ncbi:MAG: ATP-binding cassette domain-containing protein [SAR324 cluster bacterium]|nr:ATP-binding cassette domain-containing protein [SAR324 cluster bacterium]
MGFAATFAAALIGGTIGLVSGYFGGRIDSLLMRLIDTIWAFPYLLLALAIVAAFGPGLLNALMAIAIVNIPFFARTVRGTTITLTNREFVMAARTSGAGHLDILFRELLPNVLPVIVVTISTTAGWMILETAGLSFLGLGAQPPTADLGSMLGEGRKVLFTAPHVSTIPGVLILILVISLNLFGDGIRDILDPRLRGGAIRSPKAFTEVEHVESVNQSADSEGSRLQIKNLEVNLQNQQKNHPLVRKVDLLLKPGECLGLVGESGSGKSTLGKAIANLTKFEGKIYFDGKDIISSSKEIKKHIQIVFQDPYGSLSPRMTIGEIVGEGLGVHFKLSKLETQNRIDKVLSDVGIELSAKNKYPHEFSGGQRQRIAIARSLIMNPAFMILDEPTSALDRSIQIQVINLLKDIQNEYKLTYLFISHDLKVIRSMSDYIFVMKDGEIVESGLSNEVFDYPKQKYTKKLLSAALRYASD